eukprot:4741000-Prymnesium_polylepis.1
MSAWQWIPAQVGSNTPTRPRVEWSRLGSIAARSAVWRPRLPPLPAALPWVGAGGAAWLARGVIGLLQRAPVRSRSVGLPLARGAQSGWVLESRSCSLGAFLER